jgi:hypothetical protein
MSNLDFERILSDIRQFADAAKDLAELQEFCVSRIAESLPHYNWAGFYMLATNEPDVLVLWALPRRAYRARANSGRTGNLRCSRCSGQRHHC